MRLVGVVIALVVSLATLQLRAFEAECTPGGIAALLDGHRDITELTVSGTMDAADLFFIADSLPNLTVLDLSGASIEAYHGHKLKGHTAYPVATIPAGTFGATVLREVALPAGIILGDMSFASSPIETVRFAPGKLTIGAGAFADCHALKEITLLQAAICGEYAFNNCIGLLKADVDGTTYLPRGIFAGCASLSEVIGTQDVATIGDDAFAGCAALRTFSFGNKLTAIGAFAFTGSGLDEATLPASLKTVGRGTFFNCPNLRKVILPGSLSAMSDYMFTNTPADMLTLTDGLTEIGRHALSGAATVAIVLPSTLQGIGDRAMEDMTRLQSIDVNALSAVPVTGQDVWAGVEVGKVKLYTGTNRADFENAPQWQEFDIVTGQSAASAPATEPQLRAAVSGKTLVVESSGSDISLLLIFKASGEPVLSSEPGTTRCMARLDSLADGTIIIVAATLADGTRSIYKFAL